MAGIKISALPAAGTAQLTDLIPAVQSGVTNKETLQQVVNLFNANIQLGSSAQVTGLDTQLAGYLPISGGSMTGTLFLNTNAPSTALEAASKGYVDTTAAGFTVILAADYATTANLNATPAGAGVGATLTNAGAMAAFDVDGFNPTINQRILVKNQTLTQHNGVYNLTTVGSGAVNWVLTRSTDYDQAAEIQPGTLIAVNAGTANASTSWLETATVTVVDTDPILFSQFTFAPAAFLQIANNLSELTGSAATARTNIGLGTAATKAASDNGEAVVASVTGAFTAGNLAVFADTAGTIQDGGLPASLSINSFADGRLTLTSGIPVTNTDVTGATTVYFTPFKGNSISLYDGSTMWETLEFTELSIAVPGTTSTNYDVFCYNNAGTPTLELAQWSTAFVRVTNLTLQEGVYVKSGATTRRYLGTFSTTGVAGQTEDSFANRYLWNYYNRSNRPVSRVDTTASWTYSLTAYRQVRAIAANQLNIVIGVSEDQVFAASINTVLTSVASSNVAPGIGINSTTVNSAQIVQNSSVSNAGSAAHLAAQWNGFLPEGRNAIVWLESGGGSGTQTWFGRNAVGTLLQNGINGSLMG